MVLLTILTGLTLTLALLTLLPLWKHEAWWVRVWDFPRLQLATLLLALLLAKLTLLELDKSESRLLIGTSLLCLAYQLWWILPYTRLWKPEVKLATGKRPHHLRILVANVLTSNRKSPLLLAQIEQEQPDIFVTLETDAWWQTQLDTLEAVYPYSIKCPLDNLYGMHVYSRHPLNHGEISWLVEQDVPSIHAQIMLDDNIPVRMHFLHPAPPSPTENDESLERDVELLMVAKSLDGYDGPVIVTGDLNDVAWSRTTRLFRKVSQLLDPRVGRGMFNTFHAEHWFLRWPLDHLFHSRHFTLRQIARLGYIGSDHFPVLIELEYHGDQLEQQALDADHEDHQQAQETLEQKQASADDVPEPGQP